MSLNVTLLPFIFKILRSCLATAQDDVASLLEEKRSLLDRMRYLQDQVEQSQRSKR